jgi:hypothetical protein
MSVFIRKRKTSVRLNNRWGSRRNRILIALSLSIIAAASWAVSISSVTPLTEYLVASSNISSGSKINESNLVASAMDLSDTNNLYLQASEQNLSNWVLVRPVNAGELIPMSSIALKKHSDCTVMVVNLGVKLASVIRVGDRLDLWAAAQANTVESMPAQVVSSAELVSSQLNTESYSQTAQSIEVCLSPAEVRSVVSAIATKATIVGIRTQN